MANLSNYSTSMKYNKFLVFFGISLFFVACAVNPFTGQKTLALVPNSEIIPMAFQQYNQFLKTNENKIVHESSQAQMIKSVGKDIARAADLYLNANGYEDYLKNYQWEFNLIQNETANAWALPGGKVMVYTGILDIATNDAMVAAIMGHEIAHALANHGQQRMSAAQLQQLGAVAGSAVFDENQKIFATAYGLGTKFGVMLPFSRSHETQADKIGLTLMAIAGYDPQEAVHLWKRMKAQGGGAPPEFLSTHPSNQTRINNLQSWVDDAKATARKFGVTSFHK